MKKIYNSLILMAALAISNCSFGQFYDGFTGTGNIGGDCADASCNNNGWYTHSNNNSTATIDIVPGSLDYPGLQPSIGNKIYLTGNTLLLKRDVNAAVTINGNVAYYSALINLVDTTNLSENAFEKNYFMHFASEAGNTFNDNQFFARLAATTTGATTYKLGISSSSTTFTSFPTDLNCGTTYLIVVKYNKSTGKATLWVNPTSLGTTEPTSGSVTSSDSFTASGIASICIRNGYSTVVNGGTPKMYIDEIRVGETWASVTPTAQSVNTNNLIQATLYPNPAKDYIMISAEENISNVKIYDMQGRLVKEQAFAADQEIKLNVNELSNGLYNIVAYSSNGKMFISKFSK
ncbi:MAG: T9SS type A sorting domain-containing protein, partial [Bacteroidales bacterium]